MRPELPSGTVTFLFTDVEGSTRLLHQLGAEAYAEALAEHRRVIREACAAEGGVEVDTQGDAFFFAFASAPGAAAAATAFTDELASGPIRVRVGLHTGTPLLLDEGYIGDDVHRAARIAAAGHGGQVLVSASTAPLLGAGGGVRDLGNHRFKDLQDAERVFQVGPAEFPPLKSLFRTNLPVPAHPLVGRKKELVDVLRLLAGGVRALTVTGPGGIGKTRFALAAAGESAERFPDGVWFVNLNSVRERALVLPTIAQAVESDGELTPHLADKSALLLLDNFEQVVDAAPDVAELLGSCPHLTVLVTSREPVRFAFEQEYPLRPLSDTPAVELFRQRAAAVDPHLEVGHRVASAICARLDGLPLAIELAAARVKALSPEELLGRLERRLSLLTGGPRDAPERQQTLRATIEWSHDLLSADEQRLFARLSIFPGGCMLEAAEEVVDADVDMLRSLVDKSLVRFSAGRYWMLDTIREFASGRLDVSESTDLAGRHAAFFARLADRRWPAYVSGSEGWREIAEQERENLHAALAWALDLADAETALAVASGIWPLWLGRGYGRKGREWLEQALALSDPERPSPRRVHVLAGLGDIAKYQGDLDTAETAFREVLAFFRAAKELRWVAAILSSLSEIAIERGDLRRARALADESLALRRELDPGGFVLGRGLFSVADVALAEGDLDGAMSAATEALEWCEAEGSDSVFLSEILRLLGEIARACGDDFGATRYYVRSLESAARLRNEAEIVFSLGALATIASASGDSLRAARLAGSAERLREKSGLVQGRSERIPKRVEPAWSEGRAMTLEEAVEYGLASLH